MKHTQKAKKQNSTRTQKTQSKRRKKNVSRGFQCFKNILNKQFYGSQEMMFSSFADDSLFLVFINSHTDNISNN